MPKKKSPESAARASMKSLGVYKREFEPIIKIYGELAMQYETLTEKYIESGYDFSEETQTGSKKAPIVTTLETLRKDILAYAAQLCITPSGLSKVVENAFAPAKKKSGLAAAIAEAKK